MLADERLAVDAVHQGEMRRHHRTAGPPGGLGERRQPGRQGGDLRHLGTATGVGAVGVDEVVLQVEIGRASCRERVCQSGSIAGVAVSLKKKTSVRMSSSTHLSMKHMLLKLRLAHTIQSYHTG